MEFLHASIALLASMVLVLAGMVGWLYWQQQRIFQNMNNIIMVIGEIARPRITEPESVPEVKAEEISQELDELIAAAEPEEDDRVTVTEEDGVAIVEGAPEPLDTDGLESKPKKELQEILTKRGIPYGKADTKGVLVSLLKATA